MIDQLAEVMGFSYVAICDCGQLVAAIIDNPYRRSEVARQVAEWIRQGYTVERVTNERVRTDLNHCQCPQQEAMF